MIPAHAGPVARLVATSVLVATAVAASMLALTSLVLPGTWVRTGLVGVVLVAAAAGVARGMIEARSRRRDRREGSGGSVAPTLVAGLVAAWYILSRFGSPTSQADLLVGPQHLSRVVERLGDAGEIVRSEVAPVPGTLPVALLTVGGTLAVLLLADALAGGLRWPAAVGMPLLALWCPPLVLVGQVPAPVFVVVVAALLLLLSIGSDRPRRGTERPPASVRRAERFRAAVTTAVAVVVALAAGFVATASSTLPGYAGAWSQAFTTTGDTIQLAEDLDVLGSLTERSSEVVLTYTGPSEDVGPLRTYTASAFDGRRWQRGDERSGRPFGPDELLRPPDEDGIDLSSRQELTVTVVSLSDDQLPVTLDPRRVDVGGTWGYDPLRDEVVGDRTDEGDRYTIGVRQRDLGPDVLREAGPGTAEDAFLEVPDGEHTEDVAALAAEVVGDADTAYDQAIALQDWLRDPTVFTYSTQLSGVGTGDPVWDFLQSRTGYCVQFATTMSVMARMLDIPARLGVGFLPGDPVTDSGTGTTTWTVTGEDSHAWPELYFEDVGWVRFEPTPATQTGVPPEYTTADASPTENSSQAPAVPPAETRQPEAPAEPTVAESEPVVAVNADTSTGPPGWTWFVLALVVLIGGAAAAVLVRRRREPGPLDAERAWRKVVAALEREGVVLPPPTTPRQAPDAAVAALTAARGRPPAPEVHDGLEILAAAVESARYAAPHEAMPDDHGAADRSAAGLATAVETVTSKLTERPRST